MLAKYGKLLFTMMASIAIACLAISAGGCSDNAAIAGEGDTVRVLYAGTFDDGEVFDASELRDNEPLEFTIGEGEVIPGFEQAVIGMKLNEVKNVHIPAEEAYGLYYEDMVFTVDWSQLAEGLVPEVGDTLYSYNEYGQLVTITVLNVSDEGVTMDANHPMAGYDLNFEITLVEIVGSE